MAETISRLQLECERMEEHVLLALHLKYLNQYIKLDLFRDRSEYHCATMMDALGDELRIRMSAL
jgi:hypothetical protein